ncbi:MAG: condensation domain-containing protein [Polyangia bacterium]
MERALADMERAFYLLDRGTRFNGVQVVTLRGAVDVALLRQALLRLQARHPLLRVRLRGDDKKLFLTDEDHGPLPLTVQTRRSDSDWIALAEDELNRPFDREGDHLTRLQLLLGDDRSDLILSHHHVTADALSIIFAIRDLLTDLDTLRRGDILPPPESLPLRPPMPALLPPSARGLRLLPAMHHFFFKHVVGKPLRRAKTLPLSQPMPAAQRRNRVVHRALVGETLTSLKARVKKEQTTVHGALAAALLLSTSHEVFAERIAQNRATKAGCFSAVNLRGDLTPSVGKMGLYISRVTTFHQVVPLPSLMEPGARTSATADPDACAGRKAVPDDAADWAVYSHGFGDVAARFVKNFDAASPTLTGVTNLQKLPIPLKYEGACRLRTTKSPSGCRWWDSFFWR